MRSVTCASCGLIGWADGEACKRCGRPLTLNQRAPGVAPPPPPRDYGAGYNYAPAQDYFGAPAKKRVGHAVASLVIGIIGFFSFGIFLIGSIVGMTLGIVALKKEGSEPSVYGGRALAVAGIVLNIVALCMIVPLGIVAAIAIPNLLASRKAANEASAIQSLRVIMAAESTYQATEGMGRFGAMNQLSTAGLVDRQLSSGTKNGYVFTITPTGNDFEARATPLTRTSGNRSFYISSTGEIHVAAAGRPAGASDPLLESFYGSQYGSPYDSQYGSQPPRAVSPDFQSPATAPSY